MRIHCSFSKTLVWAMVFCTVCFLSCKRQAPKPSDVSKPKPTPEKKVSVEPIKPEVKPVEPNILAAADPNSVAVVVNGNKITEGEVDKIIKLQLAAMGERGQQRSPEFLEQYKTVLRGQILDSLITARLLDEKVKEAKIVITEEEAMAQLKQVAAMQKPPVTLEDFKKKMEEYGQNFEEIKQQVRNGLAYQKLIETEMSGKLAVTDEDAKKYYSENSQRFEAPEQVRASHILIRPDPNAKDPNEAKATAKTRTQDLLTKIKAGADFAQLAKANSACPSAANGGDLNYFGRGQMEPTFEKVAFETDVNNVSDIVETSYGYHIIKVTDRKAASTTSFEQAKDKIISQLTQRKRSEYVSQYVQQLRAGAKVIYPPGKEPKVEKLPPRPVPEPNKPR